MCAMMQSVYISKNVQVHMGNNFCQWWFLLTLTTPTRSMGIIGSIGRDLPSVM